MIAIGTLPADWQKALGAAASDEVLAKLDAAVAAERATHDVYPTAENVFAAFRLTPFADVRAVIIGQDPYHGPGEAHGLAFSVMPGVKVPPSLANVFRELHADLGFSIPTSGSLERWAGNGVLLLNAILTVERDHPASHKALGWRPLTTAIVRAVQELDRPVAFLLWGRFAQQVAGFVPDPHVFVRTTHPSPLSAGKGFLGSRPFSRANELLAARGVPEIDWRLEV